MTNGRPKKRKKYNSKYSAYHLSLDKFYRGNREYIRGKEAAGVEEGQELKDPGRTFDVSAEFSYATLLREMGVSLFDFWSFIFDLSMTDGFIRKKVESLTLGEKLIKLRTQYRMSLAEISKATRIQAKYLEALESGDHRELPAEVYVRGFLRSYARYLGLPDDAFIKLYDKEKHIRTHLGQVEPVKERKTIQIKNAWVMTPRTAALLAIGLILLGTFGYLFREFRSFVAEPHLALKSPAAGLVTTEGSIVVIGKTDRGAQVTINHEPVFVNPEGEFTETLSLQPGQNTIRVLATNRFDKTKEVVLSVENTTSVAQPPVPSESETGAAPFDLVVSSPLALTAVRIENDGVVVWNGPWPAEKKERFTVKESLKVTSSEPKSTFVGLPDKRPLAMEKASTETMTITYTRETLASLETTSNSP